MSVSFKQARAILFGLSTLSLLTSLLLVSLIPDADNFRDGSLLGDGGSLIHNNNPNDENNDPILRHLRNERESLINTKRVHQRFTKRQRRERQHEQEYLPAELYDIMSRQRQISEEAVDDEQKHKDINRSRLINNVPTSSPHETSTNHKDDEEKQQQEQKVSSTLTQHHQQSASSGENVQRILAQDKFPITNSDQIKRLREKEYERPNSNQASWNEEMDHHDEYHVHSNSKREEGQFSHENQLVVTKLDEKSSHKATATQQQTTMKRHNFDGGDRYGHHDATNDIGATQQHASNKDSHASRHDEEMQHFSNTKPTRHFNFQHLGGNDNMHQSSQQHRHFAFQHLGENDHNPGAVNHHERIEDVDRHFVDSRKRYSRDSTIDMTNIHEHQPRQFDQPNVDLGSQLIKKEHSTYDNSVERIENMISLGANVHKLVSVRGHAASTTPGLFVVFADHGRYSEWLLNSLNMHEQVCCSSAAYSSSSTKNNEVYTTDGEAVVAGGFPVQGLNPSVISTPTDISIVKSCSLQFVLEHIPKMVRHLTNSPNSVPVPRACMEINSANPLYEKHILERLCRFIARLKGDYSTKSIVASYIDSFLSLPLYNPATYHLNLEFGCVCSDKTSIRGLQVLSEWTYAYVEELFNVTKLHGAKVIRVTNRNHLTTYLSGLVSQEMNTAMDDSIHSEENQVDWLQKNGKKIVIDLHDMIQTIKELQHKERLSDELALKHATEVLFVDFQDLRDDNAKSVQRILQFLEVDARQSSDAYRSLTSPSSPFVQEGSQFTIFNELIANNDVVTEMLISYGYSDHLFRGHIMKSQPFAIQHMVYGNGESDQRYGTWDRQVGINTTFVRNTQSDNSKYSSLVQHLQFFPSETLVVISSGVGVSISSHIRTVASLFESLANFRSTMAKLTEHGAVVIAADTRCCSPALTHGRPGDFFTANGRRLSRSCAVSSSTQPVCDWAGDDRALPWQKFMKELAIERTGVATNNIYLDSTLIGGRAGDLARLFRDIDVLHSEDEQSVLTDFMYHDKNRIVLDYSQQVFGKSFEGVREKVNIHQGCVGGGTFEQEEDELLGHNRRPLFLSDRRDLQCDQKRAATVDRSKTFPTWNLYGIKLQPVIDHIDKFFLDGVRLPGITDTYSSEIFYAIDREIVQTSRLPEAVVRFSPMNTLILNAHKELLLSEGTERWRSLRAAVLSDGFPFWAWYGEINGCDHHDFGDGSLPLFTIAAQVGCNNAFPIPSFELVKLSKLNVGDWYDEFQRSDEEYPFSRKLRKVVWRGSLLDNDPVRVHESMEWKLAKSVHDRNLDFFDVGIDEISKHLHSVDLAPIGGLKPKLDSRRKLQQYMAIIDVGRTFENDAFISYLCYNSVVIKVETNIVSYFHYDLKAWKHYIPVKADLSDLIENVVFALNPKNEHIIKDMISSANQFCADRFVLPHLSHDLLDIWDSYIHLLDMYDSSWKSQWAAKRDRMVNSRLYDLVQLVE